LSQLVAQTLLQFRADTSQARSEIGKLGEAEKKAAQDAVDASEKRNAMYERVAAGITKLNVAMGVVTKGIELAGQAWAAYDEYQDLAAAKGAISIDGLRKASKGLKTDLDLLKLAAVSQNTTFKLTQEQLENATRAMRTFEEAGYDGAKVQAALENAIKKGSIEPLKELGVNLELAKDQTGKYNQLLEVLAEKSAAAGDAELSRGDKMKQSIVAYQNAINDLKVAVGELVVAFQPVLATLANMAQAIAAVVKEIPGEILSILAVAGGGAYASRKIAKMGAGGRLMNVAKGAAVVGTLVQTSEVLADVISEETGTFVTSGTTREQRMMAAMGGEFVAYKQRVNATIAKAEAGEQAYEAARAADAAVWDAKYNRVLATFKAEKKLSSKKILFDALIATANGDEKKIAEATRLMDAATTKAATARSAARRRVDEEGTDEVELTAEDRRRREVMTRAGAMFGGEVQLPQVPVEAMPLASGIQREIDRAEALARFQGTGKFKGKGKLQEMFGPIEEFNAYATAFQALNNVATEAFAAWVNGAELTSAAMKKMAAAALGSVASDMFARSIQHAAYALGNLAFGLAGDPRALAASAVHAKSAAAFAAGAVVVGGLARKLGGGAESAAGAGAAGGAAGYGAGGAASIGAAGSQRDMGRITNLYVGDVWGDDNPRTARQKFARSYRAARREMDSVGGVEFR
jgi:hypothetical protein